MSFEEIEKTFKAFRDRDDRREKILDRAVLMLGDAYDDDVMRRQFDNFGPDEFSEMLDRVQNGLEEEEGNDERQEAIRQSFVSTLRIKLLSSNDQK